MFDFSNTPITGTGYLGKSGLHTGATLTSVEYVSEATYEAIDITMNVGGKTFRNRKFGTSEDRVIPRKKWDKGIDVGMENQKEAYSRFFSELFTEMLYLAACYGDMKEAQEELGKFSNMKELVDKTNAFITKGDRSTTLNILVVWKNNNTKETSSLVIPERIKWVEKTQYDNKGALLPATIQLTQWQEANQKDPKYGPGAKANTNDGSAILNQINTDDLPF